MVLLCSGDVGTTNFLEIFGLHGIENGFFDQTMTLVISTEEFLKIMILKSLLRDQ